MAFKTVLTWKIKIEPLQIYSISKKDLFKANKSITKNKGKIKDLNKLLSKSLDVSAWLNNLMFKILCVKTIKKINIKLWIIHKWNKYVKLNFKFCTICKI